MIIFCKIHYLNDLYFGLWLTDFYFLIVELIYTFIRIVLIFLIIYIKKFSLSVFNEKDIAKVATLFWDIDIDKLHPHAELEQAALSDA